MVPRSFLQYVDVYGAFDERRPQHGWWMAVGPELELITESHTAYQSS